MLAAGIRLIYILQSANNSPFFYNPSIDALYHHLLAVDFARGNFEITGPFFRAPLYPLFLGSTYALFGVNIFVASLAGHLMGLVIIFLIFIIGHRYFNLATGIIASVIYIFYYPALYFEGQLLVDTLFSLCVLLSVYFLLRGSEGSIKPLSIYLAALFLGMAAITRANILLLFLPAAIWLYFRKRNFKIAFLFWAVAFIPILPVAAVNYFIGDDAVLIASQGGINFYIGSNKDADGMTANMPEFGVTWEYDDCKFYAEKQGGIRPLKPSQVSSFYLKRGLSYIMNDTGEALLLFFKKIYLSLNNFEVSNNQNIYFSRQFSSISKAAFIPFSLILGLAVMGKILGGITRKEQLLLWIVAASIWFTMVLFFVTSRFRLPIMPYLTIFAGYGISQLYNSFRQGRFRQSSKAMIAGVIAFGLSITNFAGLDKTDFAQAYFNLGNIYLRNGEWEKARAEYARAISSNERVSIARLNIGNLFFYGGEYDSAAYYYTEEIRYHPNESRAYLNLSTIELLKQNYESAGDLARKALEAKPNITPAAVNLITSYLQSGDSLMAKETGRRLIDSIGPDSRLLLALGIIFQQEGNLDSASAYYQIVLADTSQGLAAEYNLGEVYSRDLPFSANIAEARQKAEFNLAIIEIQRGIFDSALDHLLNIIESNSGFTQAWINAGLIYDLKRNYGKAEEFLNNAKGLEPDNVVVVYNLGLIYAKTGRLPNAREYFRQALSIDPNFYPAKEKLGLVEKILSGQRIEN